MLYEENDVFWECTQIYDALGKRKCEICGIRIARDADHCHKTGLIRGMLCRACNALARDPEILERVLEYVNKPPIGPPYRTYAKITHRGPSRKYTKRRYWENPDRFRHEAREYQKRKREEKRCQKSLAGS